MTDVQPSASTRAADDSRDRAGDGSDLVSDSRDSAAESDALTAYYSGELPAMEIVPAARWRDWMTATKNWANRCLPLLMANEAGWFLINPQGFTATWNGGSRVDSVAVTYEPGGSADTQLASSHFGYGIITWEIPFLFRTPPGYNLLARGPANYFKDGVFPLEGLVETDWAVATFTMNWRMTRPNLPVTFEAGEPFCMIVPQRRGQLEQLVPRTREFKTAPELRAMTKAWTERRHEVQVGKFYAEIDEGGRGWHKYWEGDYFRGRYPDGSSSPEHQTIQRLCPFSSLSDEVQ